MDDPAGERYLRLLVEEILAGGVRGNGGPATIEHAGAALVAVGSVDPGMVAAVRDDLALCLALRHPGPDAAEIAAALPRSWPGRPLTGGPDDPGSPAPLRPVVTARAVATGPNRFETPDGLLVVESISFGPDGATIVERLETPDVGPEGDQGTSRRARRPVTGPLPALEPMRPAPPRRARPHRWRSETGLEDQRWWRPAPRTTAPGRPPRNRLVGAGREGLRVTDAQGNAYRRGPGESGGDQTGWRWVSTLEPAPALDTPWLEVALGDSPSFRLTVTPTGHVARGRPHGRNAAASWLLGALQDAVGAALRDDLPVATSAIADGVDALLGLNRLGHAEPLLEQLALLDAYPEGAAELDPSIGSPLAGRDRRPPDRSVVLPLARLVDLGGRAARLDVASLYGGAFRLWGWFSPWPGGPRPDDTAGWSVTGFDDRHNHYVATVDECHRGPGGADVGWRLWPAIDPSARSLRLRLCDPGREASVEVVVE